MNTVANFGILLGLFVIAYYAATILIDLLGKPVPRDSCEDAQCCPPPDPEAAWSPTQREWEDFQRSLDDEGLDEENHNG